MRVLLRDRKLSTVCEEARCPNLGECFGRGTATFMLLGERCTRRCAYCSVSTARPLPPDPDEPERVAEAARALRLRYVVLTSVARDDLPDGGASHFAATVRAIRAKTSRPRGDDAGPARVLVEVLTPDFKGDPSALAAVLAAEPDVFNHNVEMVPRLFPSFRPQGSYPRSLDLLAEARRQGPRQRTKSGIMVGLGETDAEVEAVLADLRAVSVDVVTIGQYLRPTLAHAPVKRYVTPAGFRAYEARCRELGFPTVYSGVFVRSSFNAEEVFRLGAAGPPPAGGGID